MRSTFWNSDHKRIGLLATTGSLGVGTLGQGSPRLWYFHHQPVEMLTFRGAVATDTWLTRVAIVSAIKVEL